MISQSDLEEKLKLGYETRDFEVKGPGEFKEKRYVAKIARAAMALGNHRDGGWLCLGVDDTQIAAMQPGLSSTQVAAWMNNDNVHDALARYSDPPVSFDLASFTLPSGAEVVVFEVSEFDAEPHVCKKNFPGELQDGQTYIRPRGKPESVPIPSATESRELHDLAADKRVREFVRRAAAAGLLPVPGQAPEPADLERAAFEAEKTQAWARDTGFETARQGAAFFDIAVRPTPYRADRLRADELERFAIENTVRLRGWPVPYVEGGAALSRHGIWIGQDIEPELVPHLEAWRLFCSGQFLHRRVLVTDQRNATELTATYPGATGAVAVWDVLLYLVEVAELGARYATALGVDAITFDRALEGIAGRQLIAGDSNRDLHGPHLVSANRLEFRSAMSASRLLAEPRAVGVELAQGLLRQFGVSVPDQVLLGWQEQVFDRRR